MNSVVNSAKEPSSMELQRPIREDAASLQKIIPVAAIAAGINFGWALQFCLLTPYVQLLGIPHKYAAFIWLCGPISGMIVQPLVGYYSDRCNSRFGRRRPFIATGTALIATAVALIGFAADIGYISGDPLTVKALKPRAIAVFVTGFTIFDVANNMLLGPCRALLADLSAGNAKKTRTANAFFSFFGAVGNVLGYAAGAYTHLNNMFPFSTTPACNVYCANLKSCFLLAIALIVCLTTIALATVPEKQLSETEPGEATEPVETKPVPFFGELSAALKDLPKSMWILLLVTSLNWFAWFTFLLFDTDWMGREVYGGKPGDKLYDRGVRAGALALAINSVVVGVVSLGIEHIASRLGGVKRLWGGVNFLLAVGLAMTVVISKSAGSARHLAAVNKFTATANLPGTGVKVAVLALFAVLGIPLAITASVPFALASIFSSDSGAGQGLSQGVLNLAICVPQMILSLAAGPWDALFGGGNLPTFVVGAVAAAASGLLAMIMLPSSPPDNVLNRLPV